MDLIRVIPAIMMAIVAHADGEKSVLDFCRGVAQRKKRVGWKFQFVAVVDRERGEVYVEVGNLIAVSAGKGIVHGDVQGARSAATAIGSGDDITLGRCDFFRC